MKKKITAILLTIALLAGCEAAPATAQETAPDIDAIVQQSVAEALAQYEETQKEKDAEIAGLKAQLEELTSQAEEAPDADEQPETAPAEEPYAPASSQPEEPESQPEPEPQEPTPSQSSALSSHYDGFDLRNMYPAFIWENFQPVEEGSSTDHSWEQEYEEHDYEEASLGTLLGDDALEVIRLTNQERENHELEPLEIDDDLMALAEIRAEEASIKYSHERPDGTRVSQMGYYGENLGAKASAEKQVASWMSSDGHRANILREGYHRIGVGCYLGGNGKRYWIQVFSK